MLDGVPVFSSTRLSRLIHTMTFDVIEPTVIDASQSTILDPPVVVAKKDQILSQQPNR
jgi:hypothetical protein